MRFGIVPILLLFSFSTAFSAKNPLYEGFSLIEKGDSKAAFTAFSSVNTNSPVRFTGMGMSKYLLGDYKSSIVYLKEALKSEEESKKWATHYFAGLSLFELKNYKEALPYLETVVRIKKELPEALLKLGICYKMTGDTNSAIDALKKALKLKPDFMEVYNEIVDVLEQQNLFDEAFQVIDAGLKLFPENADLIYGRAKLLFKSGKIEEAEKELDRAMKLSKSGKIIHLYSSISAYKKPPVKRDRVSEDSQILKRGLSFSSSQLIALSAMLLLTLIIAGLYYRKGEKTDDELLYIDELLKKGDIIGVEELLNKIKEQDRVPINSLRARYHVLKGDFNSALASCEKISDVKLKQKLKGLILLYFGEREPFKKHLALLEAEGAKEIKDFLKASSFEDKDEILSKIHNVNPVNIAKS
ncbi:MAG: hypothetical protein OHK0040_01940 [bacterium]